MVFTCPVPRGTRRSLLRGALLAGAAGASAGLAGCGLFGGGKKPTAAPSAHPLAAILATTRGLVDRYQSTIAAQPTLADRLDPLLAECRTHAEALTAAAGLPSASPSAGSPSPGDTVPTDPGAALAAIKAAEQAAQAGAVSACLAASSGYAVLLGQLAASHACHVEVLG